MTTLILRPTGAGDATELSPNPSAPNWDKVEETPANDEDYVSLSGGESAQDAKDLYAFEDTAQQGQVNWVKIWVRCRKGQYGLEAAYTAIRPSGPIYFGSAINLGYNFDYYSTQYVTNPQTSLAWTFSNLNASQAGVRFKTVAMEEYGACSQVYIEVDFTEGVAATVTTQDASVVEVGSCIGNGNIIDDGGINCTKRGFCYKVGTSGDPTTEDSVVYDDGTFNEGAFTKSITGLNSGTNYRVRAYANNPYGTSYGDTVQVLTKPAAPTSVVATDGDPANKVVVTWTKSTGATGYRVYRDDVDISGLLGDVATYDDTGIDENAITPGAAVASDGKSASYVRLSLPDLSIAVSTTRTYKVRAVNATGDSADSATDTGYRYYGKLVYQWQRSAADSDASYSNISGAISASYNDAGAPVYDAPVVQWISPTGFVDATSTWGLEEDAYDGILTTNTYTSPGQGVLSEYLELTHDATVSDGMRLFFGGNPPDYIDVDAYYGDSWHNIYAGGITAGWNNYYLSSIQTITKYRFRVRRDGAGAPWIMEAEFRKIINNGRYYKCIINAVGAAQKTSAADRGYRRSPLKSGHAPMIIIKNPDGGTLGYCPLASSIRCDYRVNGLGSLAFDLPADSPVREHLIYPNETWLYSDGVLQDIFKIMRVERKR